MAERPGAAAPTPTSSLPVSARWSVQSITSKVANKKEVIKIQDEFFEIYKKNDLEQLRSFARQLDIIAEGYRAQSL